MRVGSLTILLVACILPWSFYCRRPFAFHFKTVKCIANPKFISLFECSVREKNSAATISMDIRVAEDIAKITFDLLVTLPNVRQDLILFNVSRMDGCMFFENKSKFPLVRIIRNVFDKYSNFPHKCPVLKGTLIQVRDLKMDPENFPIYVPETKFYVSVGMYENGTHLLNLTVNGTCENIRKFNNGWG